MAMPESGRGSAGPFALVLRGGRVVDPGGGLDATLDLAIEGGVVAAIGTDLRGRVVLPATGCVVAPGFIDLYSHSQSVGGHRLQAFDGVTTTLELEAGATPVGEAYARAGSEGRPLNYGYSASWAAARIQVLAGHRGDGRATTMLAHFADPAWQREARQRGQKPRRLQEKGTSRWKVQSAHRSRVKSSIPMRRLSRGAHPAIVRDSGLRHGIRTCRVERVEVRGTVGQSSCKSTSQIGRLLERWVFPPQVESRCASRSKSREA